MQHPVYAAFYTTGTRYEHEANRLRRSLDALGLDHDIRGVPDLGSWQANTHYAATFIRDVLADHPDRPVVCLDADAVVHKRPVLFDSIDCDFAAHYRQGYELLSGTLYLAPNDAARALVELWLETNRANPDVWDQKNLDVAIHQSPELRFVDLPASYCLIFDIMADDADEIVIEHLQASRDDSERTRNVALYEARRNRLRELGEIT